MRLGIGTALRASMLVLCLGFVWQGYGCAGGDKEQESGDEITASDEGASSGSSEEGSDKKKKKKKKVKKAKKAK